ncbi:cob(I)yrinic acid a,c-diamide adenosyltransferase [Arthrobacter sp. EH-1B-1]|uniref:Corrinoid adenosyltransferase n=1 Tax=Arthrobacter vasquezii TaxID=2977629 RepID=A0ABT6CU39_9MICC|nr:cob(I)yrinic acid a,c-diamide adenosyltransferase [Arthrobacter vasquezii]MDF9277582.1 cob(I)yrinic acid a,c-diamide adenosyltransferase [Arthrobacter vasquezii]
MVEEAKNYPTDGHFYTGEGDTGFTDFGGHGNCSKNDSRVVAHAECDEANAAVSVAIAAGGLPTDVSATLVSVQNDLFDVATDLAAPLNAGKQPQARMVPGHVERLERAIDHFAEEAGDLSGMVLPGGTLSGALLYQARGIVRRAERAVWAAVEEYPGVVNPVNGRYLNRLSALLFVLARNANLEHGDITWVPEASVRVPAEEEAPAAE